MSVNLADYLALTAAEMTMMMKQLFADGPIDDHSGCAFVPPLFIPPMNTQRQMLKHQHNQANVDDKRLSTY